MALPHAYECESAWHVPARLRLELLALLSADPTQTATMTYEEFLQWADEDTLAEWVDGKVVLTPPASARQQYLAAFLQNILAPYTSVHDLGTVLLVPFQMKLPHAARAPDMLFLAKEHLGRLRESYIEGPADLVVEIVSKESRGRDRGEKFYEYGEGGCAPRFRVPGRPAAEATWQGPAAQVARTVRQCRSCAMTRHGQAPSAKPLRAPGVWRRPAFSPACPACRATCGHRGHNARRGPHLNDRGNEYGSGDNRAN